MAMYRKLGFHGWPESASELSLRHPPRAFVVRHAPPEATSVERLVRSLPEWFGIESAIAEYVEAARRLETVLAWPGEGGAPIGALLLRRPFSTSAEVHLMAVDRAWHRQGVGRALIEAAERVLRRDGVELLSVKTLGPSHPDTGYAATRQFYRAMGFLPVEELHDLWPGSPCLFMIKPLNYARPRPEIGRSRHLLRWIWH